MTDQEHAAKWRELARELKLDPDAMSINHVAGCYSDGGAAIQFACFAEGSTPEQAAAKGVEAVRRRAQAIREGVSGQRPDNVRVLQIQWRGG